MNRSYLSLIGMLIFICFGFLSAAKAQTTYYPARGIYNGFLDQLNIIECNNNNSSDVGVVIDILAGDGSVLASRFVNLPAFGAVDTIVNDVLPITDTIGTYRITVTKGQEFLGDRVSCRTSFYRASAGAAAKVFEYAYVLPVENPQFGNLAGVYNSINPAATGIPVLNWLSIVNFDDQALRGVVKIYDAAGNLKANEPIGGIAPGGRRDIPLGHTEGEQTGIFVIEPDDSSAQYDAFVVRYDGNPGAGFNFAFPLKALPGSCSAAPLLASTMGNGMTDNWLEIANTNEIPINITVEVRDQAGGLLSAQQQTIQPYSQHHVYLSPIIDPARLGAVGSARVICEDPSDRLIIQSTFYGRVPGKTAIEWSYSTQDKGVSNATQGASLSVPVNTFLGFANWLKLADSSLQTSEIDFSLFDLTGAVAAAGLNGIPAGGTIDIGIHQMLPPDNIGTMTTSSKTGSASYNGEVLRVLNRIDGQIGAIVRIPGIVQQGGLSGSQSTGFFGDPQSLAPYRDKLTREEASHLLAMTSFGGNWNEVNSAMSNGLEVTVSDLMAFTPTSALDAEAFRWVDGNSDPIANLDNISWSWAGIRRYWLHHMMNTPNPFKERMALVWHDLFATSCSVVNNRNEERAMCYEHVQLLRNYALGNFKELLKEMTVDYTMLVWLNGNLNNKIEPDENYAREHWELFSMGEKTLHDGRYQLYTPTDIAEAARAFTGWTTEIRGGVAKRTFDPAKHDSGLKTLWAGTPFEVSGNFNHEDITELSLEHRFEASQFIVRRLFSTFAHDHPSHAIVNQLASMLKENNFNVAPVIRTILQSEAMFSADSRNNRVKDPVSYAIGFSRTTGIPFSVNRLEDLMEGNELGIELTNPPDVSGWPMSRYKEAHESDYFLAWGFQRANLITEIFEELDDWETDVSTGPDDDRKPEGYYFSLIMAQIGSPLPTSAQVVDHMAKLLDVRLEAFERDGLIFYMDNYYRTSNGEFEPELFDARVEDQVRRKLSGLLWILSQHEDFQRY